MYKDRPFVCVYVCVCKSFKYSDFSSDAITI